MQAINVENISRKYVLRRAVAEALKEVSFTVDQGEIFGIIGPDGAGKTTLFRILTTLILPDSGCATVEGMDVVKDFIRLRNRVGYMPGRFSLYQDLTVQENLTFFATIFHTTVQAGYGLIEDIYRQLEPYKTRKAAQLSGGMKQKLALCCALIHKPSVLFLDEPTTGVDAVSRKEFWEMLHRLQKENITILVSTAYMDEAGLCNRVALLQKGRILSVNTPRTIISSFGKPLWAVKAHNMFGLLKAMQTNAAVESCYPSGQYHHVVLKAGAGADVLQQIVDRENLTGAEIRVIEPRIEDCFMELMKA